MTNQIKIPVKLIRSFRWIRFFSLICLVNEVNRKRSLERLVFISIKLVSSLSSKQLKSIHMMVARFHPYRLLHDIIPKVLKLNKSSNQSLPMF